MSRMLRLAAVLLAGTGGSAARAEGPNPACDLLTPAGIAEAAGASVEPDGSSGDAGAGKCRWRVGEAHLVSATLVTEAALGVTGGSVLDYFRQAERNFRDSVPPGETRDLPGIGLSAYLFSTEVNNPDEAVSVTATNGADFITIDTFGLPEQVAIDLVRQAVARR